MRHVAHVQDDVGLDHLLQRGAERRHQHGRQIRDKADGIGQNDAVAVRQLDRAQRRIERGEQHVGRQHRGLRHAVEQRRLAGIGVADQRHDRIRHALAAVAMQLARALDAFELGLDALDAVLDHAAVGLELRLAGAAEKAEAAALALEMRPRAHQPALLVIQMRVLDLQRAFARARAAAEDFQDQPGAVDDLRVPGLFQIALLHRRDRAVHHHDGGFEAFGKTRRSRRPCPCRRRSPAARRRASPAPPRPRRDRWRGRGRPPRPAAPAARASSRVRPRAAFDPRLDDDGAAGLRARRAQPVGSLIATARFQSGLVPAGGSSPPSNSWIG